MGPNGPTPALATRWDVDRSGRAFTFHLRRNVRFHDGSAFGSGDVVRAWTEALQEAPTGVSHPWALDPIDGALAFAEGRAAIIRGLVVVDDSTLVVRLREPLAFFPTLLSLPHAAVSAASAGPLRPVGTGPWRWVEGGGRGSDEIRFARNDGYWGGAPRLDSLVYRFVPDSLVEQAFESGVVDIVSDVRPDTRTRWSLRSDVGFVESEAITQTRLVINMLEPVFEDLRVRQGLNHAVAATEIAAGAGAPNPVRAAGVIPPSFVGADPNRRPYAFDVEEAHRLLSEGGYPFDRPIRLWVPEPGLADYPAEIGPLLRDHLEAAGLAVELTVQNAGIETALSRRLADLVLAVWYPDYPDGDAFLYPVYHSSAAGGPGNEGWFRDPAVDRAIEAERRATDPVRRALLLRRADSLVFERAPAVFLWFTRAATAYSLRLSDWGPDPFLSRFVSVRLRSDTP